MNVTRFVIRCCASASVRSTAVKSCPQTGISGEPWAGMLTSTPLIAASTSAAEKPVLGLTGGLAQATNENQGRRHRGKTHSDALRRVPIAAGNVPNARANGMKVVYMVPKSLKSRPATQTSRKSQPISVRSTEISKKSTPATTRSTKIRTGQQEYGSGQRKYGSGQRPHR